MPMIRTLTPDQLHTPFKGATGDEPSRRSDAVQAENLKSALAAYDAPLPTFARGDVVREKQGLAIFDDDPVLVYLRPLDAADPVDLALAREDLSRMTPERVDCLVLRPTDSGGVTCCVHDSHHPELAGPDGSRITTTTETDHG
jgi:hypothetical protein